MRVVREAAVARQHVDAGEVIFFQGDLGDNVYLIEGGECEVLRETNGRQTLVAKLGVGEYFGEMAGFNDGTRNARVR